MRQAISVSGAWGMPLSPACVCKPDIPINSPLAFNSTAHTPSPFLLSANATYQPVHGSPARATHWGSSASASGLHSAGHTQDNPHPSTAVGVIVPFLTSLCTHKFFKAGDPRRDVNIFPPQGKFLGGGGQSLARHRRPRPDDCQPHGQRPVGRRGG